MQTKLKLSHVMLLILPCLALVALPAVLQGRGSTQSAPVPTIVLRNVTFTAFSPVQSPGGQLLSYVPGTWKIKALKKINVLEADTKVHLFVKYNPKSAYKRHFGSPDWLLQSSGIYTTDSKGRRYIIPTFAPPFKATHLGNNYYQVATEVVLQQIPKQEGKVTLTFNLAVDNEPFTQLTALARE